MLSERLQAADLTQREREAYEYVCEFTSSSSEIWRFSALHQFFTSEPSLHDLLPHLAKALCVLLDEHRASYFREPVEKRRRDASPYHSSAFRSDAEDAENVPPSASGGKRADQDQTNSPAEADMEMDTATASKSPSNMSDDDDDVPFLKRIHQRRATGPPSPPSESVPVQDPANTAALIRFQLETMLKVEAEVAGHTSAAARVRVTALFLSSVLLVSASSSVDDIQSAASRFVRVAKSAYSPEGSTLADKIRGWEAAAIDLRNRQKRLVARLNAEDPSCGLKKLLLLPFDATEDKVIKHLAECQALLEESCCCEENAKNAREVLDTAESEWKAIKKENEEKKRQRDNETQNKRLAEEELAKREILQRASVTYILKTEAKRAQYSDKDPRRSNPFLLLGIKPKHATLDLLKKTKQKLLMLTHPDKCPGMAKDAGQACRLVNEAVKAAIAAIHEEVHLQYSSPNNCPPYANDCGIPWP